VTYAGGVGLPEMIAAAMALALNAYALTGGADFGGGVWDLLASGPRKVDQRSLIAGALAPIWEANHVWLIVVVVVLFTAFPAAFATIGIVLHIPLTVMLIGIVLRGSAFVFRSYGSRTRELERRWGRVFAVASTVTPAVLGMMIGALASGDVGRASLRVGRKGLTIPTPGFNRPSASFLDVYVAPWLSVLSLAVGVLTLALFAYLGAVYLALAARTDALREDFRRRALVMAAVAAIAALVVLALAHGEAPRMEHSLTTSAWGTPMRIAAGIAGAAAAWALWTRRWQTARLAAAAQVSTILWGWFLAHYPLILPPTLTIRAAAAPNGTLRLLLWALIVGGGLLIPCLVYLMRTFGTSGDTESVSA